MFLHPTLPIPVLLTLDSFIVHFVSLVFYYFTCFTILTAFIDRVCLLHVFLVKVEKKILLLMHSTVKLPLHLNTSYTILRNVDVRFLTASTSRSSAVKCPMCGGMFSNV